MKNTKFEKTQFLKTEESRLLALIDRLSGNKHFGKNMRGKAINSLAVIQNELNRREQIIRGLPADSFFEVK